MTSSHSAITHATANIPKCSDIKIPTKEDLDEFWEKASRQKEKDLRDRVLRDFEKEMKQMFIYNRSKFSIGVSKKKADFFVAEFETQGYKPKLIRWNDRVRLDEYELVFYRKDIDPNYVVEPACQCCVIV